MTGLDQDMMQRTLSCRNRTEAQRNVMISGVLQLVVIAMMLALGVVLERYAVEILPSGEIRGDELFLSVACAPTMPAVAGVLFVLGVVASSLSSAGSAVTALTTSLVYDLGGGDVRRRRVVLPLVAGLIVALAVVLRAVADGSAIDLVFRLAAYTYGPILGLFAFGVLTRRRPSPVATCLMAVVAPLLTLLVDHFTPVLCGGYRFGHDILAVNGLIMFVGMLIFSQKNVTLRKQNHRK
jgi:Na+/proline symporter